MDLLSVAFEVIMIGSVVVGIGFLVNWFVDSQDKKSEESKPVEQSSVRDLRQTRTEPDLWHKDETKKPKKKKTTKKKKAKTKSQSGGKSKAASSNVKQSKK